MEPLCACFLICQIGITIVPTLLELNMFTHVRLTAVPVHVFAGILLIILSWSVGVEEATA